MLDIFIVENPDEGDTRLTYFPKHENGNVYQNIQFFCINQFLHSEQGIKKDYSAIVFLHRSNEEALDGDPFSDAEGWPRGANLLAYVSLRVSLAGGRVVIFSGGDPSLNQENLIGIMNKNGFNRGHHFEFIPINKINKNHPDLTMQTIPLDWRVDKLNSEKKQFSQLSNIIVSFTALDILLQGYLIINSDSSEWVDVRKNLGFHNQERIRTGKDKTSFNRLFGSDTSCKEYWFDCLDVCIHDSSKNNDYELFSHIADSIFKGNTSLESWKKDKKIFFRKCLFSEDSKGPANQIIQSVESDKNISKKLDEIISYEGGGLRLCWEMIKGKGVAFKANVTNILEKNNQTSLLTELFQKAHDEFTRFMILIRKDLD